MASFAAAPFHLVSCTYSMHCNGASTIGHSLMGNDPSVFLSVRRGPAKRVRARAPGLARMKRLRGPPRGSAEDDPSPGAQSSGYKAPRRLDSERTVTAVSALGTDAAEEDAPEAAQAARAEPAHAPARAAPRGLSLLTEAGVVLTGAAEEHHIIGGAAAARQRAGLDSNSGGPARARLCVHARRRAGLCAQQARAALPHERKGAARVRARARASPAQRGGLRAGSCLRWRPCWATTRSCASGCGARGPALAALRASRLARHGQRRSQLMIHAARAASSPVSFTSCWVSGQGGSARRYSRRRRSPCAGVDALQGPLSSTLVEKLAQCVSSE
jgi:hypothetical protein